MKNFVFILFLLFFPLSSCTKRFTTPIYNDPIYNKEEVKYKKLEEGASPYTQREENPSDNYKYSPHPDESYHEFSQRLVNTMTVQEYEKEQLRMELENKMRILEEQKEQLAELLRKQVDLRLEFMRTTDTEILQSATGDPLFKRYVIREGDTLQKIAFQFYNSHAGWLTIYRFNRDQLPYGPNRIHPGQILQVPIIAQNGYE